MMDTPFAAREDQVAVQPELPGDALQSDLARGPLERLWAFVASPACAAILLALAALLILVSAVFPQLSPATSDAASREQWLAETAARWGTLGPTLRTLGIFQILDSLLWKICLGLGVWALLLRLEVSARRAWGFARGDVSGMEVRFREEAEVAGAAETVLSSVRRDLEERGFRARIVQDANLSSLHAVRQPRALFLRATCVLGALLIVVSILLSGAGARWEQIALGPGESAPLSLRSGWSARLKDFAAEPGDDTQFRGALAVFGPEADLLAEGVIAMERPLWVKGLTLHMSGTGPGLQVGAAGKAGKPMMLQPASGAAQVESLFLRFDEDQPEQYFAVPEVGDTVRVVLHPGAGGSPRGFLVQVYRGVEVQPRAEKLLSGSSSLIVEDVTYSFAAMEYPVLIASSNPARGLLWAGAIIAILAALAMLFFKSSGVLVRAAERNGRAYLQFLTDGAEAMGIVRGAVADAHEEGTA